MNNNIALIGWGIRNGKETFFHSGNVDPNDLEIKNTLEDVRSIMSFRFANKVFYSLEFTSTYKVYTIYKTTHDSAGENRVNAYLALSLFVPYDTKFDNGVVDVLKRILEIYHRNYIDENLKIRKRVREDVSLFANAINRFKKSDFLYPANRPNDSSQTAYGYIRYKNEKHLNDYFNNPFLSDYKDYKEVFFLPEVENKLEINSKVLKPLATQSQELSFKIKFKLIAKGEDIEKPYEFTINGKEQTNNCTVNYNDLKILPQIHIKFKKNGFDVIDEEVNLTDFDKRARKGIYEIAVQERKYNLALRVVAGRKGEDNIPNAMVKIYNHRTRTTDNFKTDKEGKIVTPDLKITDRIDVTVEAKGYETKEEPFSYKPHLSEKIINKTIKLKTLLIRPEATKKNNISKPQQQQISPFVGETSTSSTSNSGNEPRRKKTVEIRIKDNATREDVTIDAANDRIVVDGTMHPLQKASIRIPNLEDTDTLKYKIQVQGYKENFINRGKVGTIDVEEKGIKILEVFLTKDENSNRGGNYINANKSKNTQKILKKELIPVTIFFLLCALGYIAFHFYQIKQNKKGLENKKSELRKQLDKETRELRDNVKSVKDSISALDKINMGADNAYTNLKGELAKEHEKYLKDILSIEEQITKDSTASGNSISQMDSVGMSTEINVNIDKFSYTDGLKIGELKDEVSNYKRELLGNVEKVKNGISNNERQRQLQQKKKEREIAKISKFSKIANVGGMQTETIKKHLDNAKKHGNGMDKKTITRLEALYKIRRLIYSYENDKNSEITPSKTKKDIRDAMKNSELTGSQIRWLNRYVNDLI